jgi:hypothetical protein
MRCQQQQGRQETAETLASMAFDVKCKKIYTNCRTDNSTRMLITVLYVCKQQQGRKQQYGRQQHHVHYSNSRNTRNVERDVNSSRGGSNSRESSNSKDSRTSTAVRTLAAAKQEILELHCKKTHFKNF